MNNSKPNFAFQPENYRLLIIGLAINLVGFLLMIGGGTEDPNQFNAAELFSPVRITVAPILIVVGYAVMIYSIMRKAKPSKSEETQK